MTTTSFEKVLSANDLGLTGGHMGGILVPRTESGLIELFPHLDPGEYNPSVFLNFRDPNGITHSLRFVYYNNKLHRKGTRNEYRLTCLTDFLRYSNAEKGDAFRITRDETGQFAMEVIKKNTAKPISVIKLSGWNRIC